MLFFPSTLDHGSSSLEQQNFCFTEKLWLASVWTSPVLQTKATKHILPLVLLLSLRQSLYRTGNVWRDSYMIMLTFSSMTELSKDNLQTLLQWLISCTFTQKYLMYCSTHQSLLLYSQRLFGIYPSPPSRSSLLLSKIPPGEQWVYAKSVECFDSKKILKSRFGT